MSLLQEFLDSPVVCLRQFCKLPATEKSELKTGTIPISSKDWQTALTGFETNYDVHESGLYCFWWLGKQADLENGFATHWLKGKVIGGDAGRIHPDLQELRGGYVMHKITWQFPRRVKPGGVPLYIGKGSSVFKRVKLHLQWPKSAWPKYSKPPQVSEIQRAGSVNSQTQFRKPFEYLFQTVTDDVVRTQLLLANVGLSFINRPFYDVAARFFGEDELIGALRPPFNLDSER